MGILSIYLLVCLVSFIVGLCAEKFSYGYVRLSEFLGILIVSMLPVANVVMLLGGVVYLLCEIFGEYGNKRLF